MRDEDRRCAENVGDGKGDGRGEDAVGVGDVNGVKPLVERPKRELPLALLVLLTIALTLNVCRETGVTERKFCCCG